MGKGTIGNNGKSCNILNWNIFMDYGKSIKSMATVINFTMATMALPRLSESLQIISKTLVLLVIFTVATTVLPC